MKLPKETYSEIMTAVFDKDFDAALSVLDRLSYAQRLELLQYSNNRLQTSRLISHIISSHADD